MIDWTCAKRSGTWSAHLDGRLLATVRRAGIDWSVRWHIPDPGSAATYPLRETAVAAVETHILKLIAAGTFVAGKDVDGNDAS